MGPFEHGPILTGAGKDVNWQIDPRTAAGSTQPFTISQPGSYYLTANLTGVSAASGIVITADNVKLDLAGFAVVGVAGAVNGIVVSGSHHNTATRNGTVRNWPCKFFEVTLL